MTRILGIVFAVLALVGLFLLPAGSRSRLAVLDVFQWISAGEVAATGEGLEEGAESVKLSELLFDSPAAEKLEPGKLKFLLGGARLAGGDQEELEVHGELRGAIVRGLRQAAGDQGLELELVGDEMPAVYGLSFLVELGEDELSISWHMPGELEEKRTMPWSPAGPTSLLPPLVAILLAILIRKPVVSLFAGVLAGAYLLRMGSGENLVFSLLGGLQDVAVIFFWNEFSDGDRMKVIGFVVAMLAMVGVITKNGGIRGLMNHVARLAKTARSTQVATFLMGLIVFFDDYANTILVGSTMRPLSDRFQIAREKLAYIVDSTAAPVAGLSIFSTWIAFEVSTFSAQLPLAGLTPGDGYSVFIDTLPYRFYCILALALVGLVAFTGRDFGPMLKAERRARSTGFLVRQGGTPMVSDLATAMKPAPGITIRAWRAIVPLVVFIGVTLVTILATGVLSLLAEAGPDATFWSVFAEQGLSKILGAADSYLALWYGSLSGLVVAVVASLLAGLRGQIADAAWKTLRAMGVALAILYLAWMIGAVCGALGTANYLTVMLDNVLLPLALPLILFILSGAIAFSTGSSWSTMSILLPLVVGLSFTLGERIDLGGYSLMVLSIGAVLEGSIFGDHCSPISDTTVLSSVASASDHIDHVRTQGPYAFLTMVVALAVGYLPAAVFGLHPVLSLLAGVAVLYLALRILGERVDEAPAS